MSNDAVQSYKSRSAVYPYRNVGRNSYYMGETPSFDPRNITFLRHIVEEGAETGQNYQGFGNYDATRCLAELACVEEGAVPDLAELVRKTAAWVAQTKPIEQNGILAKNADVLDMISVYNYLLDQEVAGITQEDKDAFLSETQGKMSASWVKEKQRVLGRREISFSDSSGRVDLLNNTYQQLLSYGVTVNAAYGSDVISDEEILDVAEKVYKFMSPDHVKTQCDAVKDPHAPAVDRAGVIRGLENLLSDYQYILKPYSSGELGLQKTIDDRVSSMLSGSIKIANQELDTLRDIQSPSRVLVRELKADASRLARGFANAMCGLVNLPFYHTPTAAQDYKKK